jgi:hypothetical protein
MKLTKLFKEPALNMKGVEKSEVLSLRFDELADFICNLSGGEKRELSIALTKLEEACFFAKKAMASNFRYELKDEFYE